jgi:hypothetical protein
MNGFVFSIEYFPNCPRHDGGKYSGLERVNTENELLSFALRNLNHKHILDVIDLSDRYDEISFEYIAESHRFCGIEYHKDGDLIKKTVDNGSGILIWKNEDE